MTEPLARRRHFESLDAMRFFAFFAVFLHHTSDLSIPFLDIFQHSGGLAVRFFFTLSGFLISYIILEEKQRTGNLNLKSFFVRRILRIGPLYYLMLLFAFCTPYILNWLNMGSSEEGYTPNWLMSILFLENYKTMIEGQLANVSPLGVMWSLCIEEHFYIVWGIVFFFIKLRHTLAFLFASLLICFLARIVFIMNDWSMLELLTNLDFFACGAIPACLLIRYKDAFEKRVMQISYIYKYIVIAGAAVLFFSVHLFPLSDSMKHLLFSPLFACLFAFIIACTVPHNNKIVITRNNIFSRLGKYTYGLYLYHTIILSLSFQLSNQLGLSLQSPFVSLLFFLVSLVAVILVSILSYQLIEVRFLKLKRYF